MTTPLLPFNGDCIPEQLKAEKRWAPWRAEWNVKRKKWDKIPHRADNPQFGLSTAKPDQWFKYDMAESALKRNPVKLAGLGFCMTGVQGIVGIDLDNCVTNGAPEPWAAEIIAMLDSYTERSPSGTGYRILVIGGVPGDWNNHERGIEVYGGHQPRFLTITGQHLVGTPDDVMPVRPGVLEELATKYARTRPQANPLDLEIPELLPEDEVPKVNDIPLPADVAKFFTDGDFGADRSAMLHRAGISLYGANLTDTEVLSVLAGNPHAMAVAMDHRGQDYDRALLYLWREHCIKAKAKGGSSIATAEEFDCLVPAGAYCDPEPRFKGVSLKDGSIPATIENATSACMSPRYCAMDIRYDGFRDEIVWTPPGRKEWRPFGDDDYVRLRICLEQQRFKPVGRELIRDVVFFVAKQRPFDTAIEWINTLRWDGVHRIDTLLIDYFGAPDTPYVRAVSRYMWTALAGRVLTPGCKVDMVPILVGHQGLRKTSGVAAIAPDLAYFVEIAFNEKDDDLSRKLRGRLVAEVAELRGLHTKDQEWIKAFITRTAETWVPKYREFATFFHRRNIFIGTTNQDEFLADETGNRRWLPVTVSRVDVEGIIQVRDQLWAEAADTYLLYGVAYQEAERLAEAIHQDYAIGDSWSDAIEKWLKLPDDLDETITPAARPYLRVTEVLNGALRIEDRHITRGDEMRAGRALRSLGYTRRRLREGGRLSWVYVRGSAKS